MPLFLNLCRSLPIILVHAMTPPPPSASFLTGADRHQPSPESINLPAGPPPLTSLSSSFLLQSGMLARPSGVGGGPHIPPCRSTIGGGGRNKGDGGCLATQNTHTHTLTPHTLLQDSSQKPAAALSVDLVTIQLIVSPRLLTAR